MRAEGTAWSCAEEGQSGCEESILPHRAMSMEQAAQGDGHSTDLAGLKKCLDNGFTYKVWILGRPLWRQESDLIFEGLFQLRTFFSVIVR